MRAPKMLGQPRQGTLPGLHPQKCRHAPPKPASPPHRPARQGQQQGSDSSKAGERGLAAPRQARHRRRKAQHTAADGQQQHGHSSTPLALLSRLVGQALSQLPLGPARRPRPRAQQAKAARPGSRQPRLQGVQQQQAKPDAPGEAGVGVQAPGGALDWDRIAGAHKPVGLILGSAHVLATTCQLTGLEAPCWEAAAVGCCVGTLYALLNRYGMRRFWRPPTRRLNVVITGSTKGLGKALAREFLRAGDKVMISARSMQNVRRTMSELRQQEGAECYVDGVDCEVSSPAGVDRLADSARSSMGHVDLWINNAGFCAGFQDFLDTSPEQLQQVVATNLTGTLLCTRRALRLLGSQPQGGHLFNLDGAGGDGSATACYAAYGATKAGIAQFMRSLKAEGFVQRGSSRVGCHTLSPGMILTELLLSGATVGNKAIFNVLCEQPETVAAYLVPRMRTVAARGDMARSIRFLTVPRALARFLSAPLRAGRFFNAAGEAMYLSEHERLLGLGIKRTARLAKAASRRSRPLAAAYSGTMVACYLLLCHHALLA